MIRLGARDPRSRECPLVAQAAWILALRQVSASDGDEFASLCHDLALFVEQFEWIKPGAEARRQEQQLQLPVRIHQPRPDRTTDDCSDKRSTTLRRKLNTAASRLAISGIELEDLSPRPVGFRGHDCERTPTSNRSQDLANHSLNLAPCPPARWRLESRRP
jgi:hypothetical protein